MPANFSLQEILKGDLTQLGELFQLAASPSPASSLRANTAEKLSAFVLKEEQFDSTLAAQVIALQKAAAHCIALDDSFYSNPKHPVRSAIQIMLNRARFWYNRDSKSSQQFLEKLNGFINACTSGAQETWPAAETEFQIWLDAEDKRATMLETRLCETEVNHFKMLHNECFVLDFINSTLRQHAFPQEQLSEIESILKNELLNAYLISGTMGEFWELWQKLLPHLGKIFTTIAQPELSEEDEQTLYRTIPALLNELERSLSINTSNPDRYRQWIESLCEQLMLAIKKQTISCTSFNPLAYPEGYNNLNTRVTADVMQQTQSLQEGDWILFNGDNSMIRCKLALRNNETDQLLFVDHTGRKVMNKSLKDFAICLSTGIAKKIPPVNIDDVISKIIQALIDLHHQKKAQAEAQLAAQRAKAVADAERERQAEALGQAEAQAEENKRVANELAIRQAAAQKALTEAAAIAEERARRAAEQKLEQERLRLQLEAEQAAENLQRIQLANIHISSLNLGARVELMLNNEPVRCKLAVIIAATGKYIFVDNLGRKTAEFQREQLVQALLDNHLTLVNNGDSFDDQLVKVIRSLRKDIS